MTAKVKAGLITGAFGLALNSCAGAAVCICGPMTALVIGAITGFVAVQEEKPLTRDEGARSGAIAGLIAGALTSAGQVIGGIVAPTFAQASQTSDLFESVLGIDPTTQFFYWVDILVLGLCFGIVGIVMSSLAGAGAGYFGTREQAKTGPVI